MDLIFYCSQATAFAVQWLYIVLYMFYNDIIFSSLFTFWRGERGFCTQSIPPILVALSKNIYDR